MIRTGWLAAALLTVAPWTCFGQGGGMGGMGFGMGGGSQKPLENWTVKVESFGNQSVTGKLRLASVTVQCDLGSYEIKPEKIKAIELVAPEAGAAPTYTQFVIHRPGSVVMSSGEKVSGTILVPINWQIETDLGVLTPDAQKLKTFTFVARLPADPEPVGRGGVSVRTPNRQGGVNPAANKPAEGKPGTTASPTDGSKPGDPAKPESSDGGKKPTDPAKTS